MLFLKIESLIFANGNAKVRGFLQGISYFFNDLTKVAPNFKD